mgnify:CR=1 FL=1
MDDALQVLAEHQQGLLLAEIGALLHDIGKLSSGFLLPGPTQHLWAEFHHSILTRLTLGITKLASLSERTIITGVARAREIMEEGVCDEGELRKAIQECGASRRQAEVLVGEAVVGTSFLSPESQQTLESTVFGLFGQSVVLGDLIEEHHSKFFSRRTKQRDDRSLISQLLQHADYCDSGADKGDATQPQDIRTFVSTAFGKEHVVALSDAHNLPEQVLLPCVDRAHRLEILAPAFLHALGETRRPANDVTLWDHAYSVASLLKSAAAGAILGKWKDPQTIGWRILRVNVDVLALYARAVTIADLLAYREAVEAAWREVKRIVEEEYPLGNEVYRDTTGIYFTYPDLDLIPDLAERIRAAMEEVEPELAPHIAVGKGYGEKPADQLKRILADQRVAGRQDIAFPFSFEKAPEWWAACWQDLPEGCREVCPICRLRPMPEKEKGCKHCLKRREPRVQPWLEERPSETIWLDEIADHNGRLALVVAKFGLDDWLSGDLVESMLVKAVKGQCESKNPSPARLRRVWQTTQAFWDETVAGTILADHPYAAETRASALRRCRVAVVPDDRGGWREDIPYDGTIAGRPISLLWRGDAQRFITVSNLQMAAGEARTIEELVEEWKGAEVRVAPADSPRETGEFTVQEVIGNRCGRFLEPSLRLGHPEAGRMGHYTPSLPLVTSPDQFLALVPTRDALDLAQRIFCRYKDEFARVRNRLPLFLGLVFFPRKLPLQAVIDTARRMLAGVELKEESWPLASAHDGRLTFENGVSWTFPLKMGDVTTDDLWYPYVALEEGDTHERDLYFTHKSRTWVHAKHLQAGDTVRVYPSRFTYTFLENTAQRFLFDPAKDVLLLEELSQLREMWRSLRKQRDLTDTKLQGVAALFEAKRAAWRIDEAPDDSDERRALRDLAEATLARETLPGVTPEDVLNGRFDRCLHLHLHILRARLKEES